MSDEDIGTRIQNVGNSITKVGVMLTVLITIPIVGLVIAGWLGLAVGLVIAVLYVAGRSAA